MAIAIYQDTDGLLHWAESTSRNTREQLATGDWLLFDGTPTTPPPHVDAFDAALAQRLRDAASDVRRALAVLGLGDGGVADGAVTSEKLAPAAVTTPALADGAATAAKVGDDVATLVDGRLPEVVLPSRLEAAELATASLEALQAAIDVAPAGRWDFAQLPTVDGAPLADAPGVKTTDASGLTSGTLPTDRIADASLPATKLDFDPATQAELVEASTADRQRANHTGQQAAATIADLVEAVQDIVGGMVSGASGVTTSYTDNGDGTGTLVITGASGTGSFDAESARDAIGAALVGVGLIVVAVDDLGDTITISTSATTNSTDAQLRDRSTHTGTQPASSITGLAGVATTGKYSDLVDAPPVAAAGSRSDFTARLYGLQTWSMDPLIATATQVLVSGTEYGSRVPVAPGQTLSEIVAYATAAGAGLTLVRAGVRALDGSLLAVTADLAPTWAAGLRRAPFTAPYVVPAGVDSVFLSLLAVGTTAPTMSRSASPSTAAILALTMAGARSYAKTNQTDLPAAQDVSGPSNLTLLLAAA